MRQGFCTGWEKAPGAATAEERQKRGSENVGAIGNRAAEGSGSEAEQLCHPQQRTECRSETGDGSGRSDVGRQTNRRPTSPFQPQRRVSRNSGARNLQPRIGRRATLQSGGDFDLGAATAGETEFNFF